MRRILIGLVPALVVGWAAAGDVLQVPAVYSTIAAAVSASAAGDTVEIAAGVYRENLILSLPIALRADPAQPEAVVLEAADTFQPVIQVRGASQGASGSLIEGLTISGAAVSFGVSVADTSQVRIHACVFEKNLTAVDAAGSSVVAIEACTFRDNYSSCAQARDTATVRIADSSFRGGAGMELVRTISLSQAILLVENSSFVGSDAGQGVYIAEGGTAVVRSCSFRNFEDAIQTHGGTDLRVEENYITGCASGVTVWNGQPSSTVAHVLSNKMEDCYCGVTLTGRSKSLDISYNTISAHYMGIFIALPACGSAAAPFEGEITGIGNQISPDACPPFSSPFWPSGFLKS